MRSPCDVTERAISVPWRPGGGRVRCAFKEARTIMTTQGKAAVLTQLIEAFCAKDLDRVRALVDDRIVHQETGTGRRLDGADAYQRTLEVRHEGLLQPGDGTSRCCEA